MATKSLYVGNLPYSVTESELMSMFNAYSPSTARIIEGRGFGFVEVDAAQAESAITAKHDTELGGRRLVVNEARPKNEDGGGNRSYGNGGRQRNSNTRRY